MKIILEVTPMSAPRMNRAGAWAKKKYWAYRNELVKQWIDLHGGRDPDLPGVVSVTFYLPMPVSWSGRKRDRMAGSPHITKKKHDIDNLAKGVFDALCTHDGHIYDARLRKFWAYEGLIIIEY